MPLRPGQAFSERSGLLLCVAVLGTVFPARLHCCSYEIVSTVVEMNVSRFRPTQPIRSAFAPRFSGEASLSSLSSDNSYACCLCVSFPALAPRCCRPLPPCLPTPVRGIYAVEKRLQPSGLLAAGGAPREGRAERVSDGGGPHGSGSGSGGIFHERGGRQGAPDRP